VVHDMDPAWTSTAPGVLDVSADSQAFVGDGGASNQLVARAGAAGASAEFAPPSPLDLGAFDELRFWVLGPVRADGSPAAPFYLEFSYVDANDAADETHRWFVPVDRPGVWEQRRIGIERDRRRAITRLRFTCLGNAPFTCRVDDLLAVRDEMLTDVEEALTGRLTGIELPSLTGIPFSQTASPDHTQLVLAHAPGLAVGNRLRLAGGRAAPGTEEHDIALLTHDPAAATSVVTLAAGDSVSNTFTPDVATASLVIPVVVENLPNSTTNPGPAILVASLDAREDLNRTGYLIQRDSFRRRGALTVCSVRSAPRAYFVDYQVMVVAPERDQQRRIQTAIFDRLSMDVGLRVNGSVCPVSFLPPITPPERRLVEPIYLRIGSRLDTAPRRERPWVRHAVVAAGPLDAPGDADGLVVDR
jgi:hypothetical protein